MSATNRKKPPADIPNSQQSDNDQPNPANSFNVLSFVAGLVFMVAGLSFLGQQNGWFTIDLGTVLPIVAIVGGLAAIFGHRRND